MTFSEQVQRGLRIRMLVAQAIAYTAIFMMPGGDEQCEAFAWAVDRLFRDGLISPRGEIKDIPTLRRLLNDAVGGCTHLQKVFLGIGDIEGEVVHINRSLAPKSMKEEYLEEALHRLEEAASHLKQLEEASKPAA